MSGFEQFSQTGRRVVRVSLALGVVSDTWAPAAFTATLDASEAL